MKACDCRMAVAEKVGAQIVPRRQVHVQDDRRATFSSNVSLDNGASNSCYHSCPPLSVRFTVRKPSAVGRDNMATITSTSMAPSAQETLGPLYVDTQHEDLVHDAQLDYYGCKLATSSSGKFVVACGQFKRCSFLDLIPPFSLSTNRSNHQSLQCLGNIIRTFGHPPRKLKLPSCGIAMLCSTHFTNPRLGPRGSSLAGIMESPKVWCHFGFL